MSALALFAPEIVVERHGEPMTTSLVIAEGVKREHKTVIQLVRNRAEDIGAFGELAFEMRVNPHGPHTEVAWLNEQQATFLVTLMRNSPIVVAFKKALIREFFALRDRLRAAHAAPGPFLTGNPAHAADQLVSADRIFRSLLRSGRSVGLPLPRILRRANEVARQRTGIDLFEELEAPAPQDNAAALIDPHGAQAFCDAWLAGGLPLPVAPCRSADLYAAYCHWQGGTGAPLTRVIGAIIRRPDIRHLRARHLNEAGREVMSGFVLPEHERTQPAGITQSEWLTHHARQFAAALCLWRSPPE